MIRTALDRNILIYAELEPESEKGKRSADLILRAARDGVIPAQVLGEYLRFVQRRVPERFDDAIRQTFIYQAVFLRRQPPTPSSTRLASWRARIESSFGTAWCARSRRELGRKCS